MSNVKLSNSTLLCTVDEEFYTQVSRYTWRINTHGYASTEKRINGKRTTILLHRLILGATKGSMVDHKNRNKLDNRLENLRFSTKQQNMWNRAKLQSNTTGYTGISWYKPYSKWRAVIRVSGKSKTIGYFATKHEASLAREEFARQLHGEFYCPQD